MRSLTLSTLRQFNAVQFNAALIIKALGSVRPVLALTGQAKKAAEQCTLVLANVALTLGTEPTAQAA